MPEGWYADAEVVLRVLLGMILGGIIGWDREHSGQSAGLRTNMLIGLSAALFTTTGDLLLRHFQHYGSVVHTDPIRVLQAIVLGVSFLGSGIIFVSRRADKVKGLTTAASVWTIVGVGIVVGNRSLHAGNCNHGDSIRGAGSSPKNRNSSGSQAGLALLISRRFTGQLPWFVRL